MMLRQGDVAARVTKLPANVKRVPLKKLLVLAEGEQTGHAHTINADGIEGFEDALGRRFFTVLAEGGVALDHQEHDTLTLPPGNYEIRQQVEYAPESIRNVAD